LRDGYCVESAIGIPTTLPKYSVESRDLKKLNLGIIKNSNQERNATAVWNVP
jgi:hypothetical protein